MTITMKTEKIIIENDKVQAISPEGIIASMKLRVLLEKLSMSRMDASSVVLPDGIKAIISRGPIVVWIHQMSPRICCLKWITKDSRVPYGPETKYRLIRIALPYVCVLVVFRRKRGGRMELTHRNECFFRNEPLSSLDDRLMYPALLNCSKFSPNDGMPLSWLCTQHLDINSIASISEENQYMRTAIVKVLSCLWDTGFNLSSEKHEGNSWFSETVRRKVDPRISSVESWEEATERDPLFAMKVAWLDTGKSVKEVIDRIFDINGARAYCFESARELARLIFHSAESRSRTSEGAV